MMAQKTETRCIRTLLCCVAFVSFMLVPGSAFALRISGPGDAALSGALMQDFDGEAADTYRQGYFGATEAQPIQYFAARSPGDDSSYVPVPEPNVAMLLGLSLLTLAGTRIRDLQPRPPAPPDPDES
jgi:hypothetical protein